MSAELLNDSKFQATQKRLIKMCGASDLTRFGAKVLYETNNFLTVFDRTITTFGGFVDLQRSFAKNLHSETKVDKHCKGCDWLTGKRPKAKLMHCGAWSFCPWCCAYEGAMFYDRHRDVIDNKTTCSDVFLVQKNWETFQDFEAGFVDFMNLWLGIASMNFEFLKSHLSPIHNGSVRLPVLNAGSSVLFRSSSSASPDFAVMTVVRVLSTYPIDWKFQAEQQQSLRSLATIYHGERCFSSKNGVDFEQAVKGLYTFDHRVLKSDPDIMSDILKFNRANGLKLRRSMGIFHGKFNRRFTGAKYAIKK